MKTITLTIFILILNQIFVISQPCSPYNITFTTQEEIDNFQSFYPNCTEILGDVEILDSEINNLLGLNVLTYIGGDLWLGSPWAGGTNTVMTSLEGLNNLDSVGEHLYIEGRHGLTNLEGLDNLTIIGGRLNIFNNDGLTSLDGLENLTTIRGSLSIGIADYNPNLASLEGLINLTYIGLNLSIGMTNYLTSLTGLENVSYVGANLRLSNNQALSSITSLSNISSIGEDLSIWGNTSLTNLEGLENIVSMNGSITIHGNASLVNIESLSNITPVTITDLYIRFNDTLAVCDVESICNYLNNPNGTIEIYDNATGCNSQEEIEEACEVSINEFGFRDNIIISPNPCNETFHLQYTIQEQDLVICKLFELSGIHIKELLNENKLPGTYEVEIDLSDLSAGIYFCILRTNSGIQSKKIVKL